MWSQPPSITKKMGKIQPNAFQNRGISQLLNAFPNSNIEGKTSIVFTPWRVTYRTTRYVIAEELAGQTVLME
jgi:hypothetical protein